MFYLLRGIWHREQDPSASAGLRSYILHQMFERSFRESFQSRPAFCLPRRSIRMLSQKASRWIPEEFFAFVNRAEEAWVKHFSGLAILNGAGVWINVPSALKEARVDLLRSQDQNLYVLRAFCRPQGVWLQIGRGSSSWNRYVNRSTAWYLWAHWTEQSKFWRWERNRGII